MAELYVIGSLRNPKIPEVAAAIRECGLEAFDDWFAAGPEADDYWQKYEQGRGRSFKQALKGHAAQHVFQFDKTNLERCDGAVLVMPAGKSGHMELAWMAGRGKKTFVLLDGEPERWDVMYQFVDEVWTSIEEMKVRLEDWFGLAVTKEPAQGKSLTDWLKKAQEDYEEVKRKRSIDAGKWDTYGF